MFPANSDWKTLYLTYSYLLENFETFCKVCYNFVSKISNDDIALITEIIQITTPFEKFANKLEQENRPTISLLFPGLLHLISILQVMTIKI